MNTKRSPRPSTLPFRSPYDADLHPKTFVTRTLSVSSDIYVKIEKKLQKFLSEVRSLVHKDENPADRVCQLNVQLFPQARAKP